MNRKQDKRTALANNPVLQTEGEEERAARLAPSRRRGRRADSWLEEALDEYEWEQDELGGTPVLGGTLP